MYAPGVYLNVKYSFRTFRMKNSFVSHFYWEAESYKTWNDWNVNTPLYTSIWLEIDAFCLRLMIQRASASCVNVALVYWKLII